jgi:hypothetical protein
MKPDYYLTRLDELDAFLATLERGSVREVGASAGGRPIHAVAWGEKEEIARTAPLVAALSARKPETFYGQTSRQTLMIVSTIHGGEMESIAGVANLMHVLETGEDLKGVAWPAIAECAGKLRVVIVPCANPDGRAHIPDDRDDPTAWTEDENVEWRHGRYANGELAHWPGSKAPLPARAEDYRFMGGYFNDARVIPDYGYFLGAALDPEAHALLALALEEHADCVLDLHSCETGPFMIVGDRCLPEFLREAQFRIDGAFRQKLRDRDLGPRPWTVTAGGEAMDLRALYWHAAGALPLIFEAPNGMYPGHIWPHEKIVDMYLTLFEVMLTIGAHERYRVVRRPTE